MKSQTYSPDTYGWHAPEKGERQTVTAVAPERETEPKLYLPNGQALCEQPRKIGFK